MDSKYNEFIENYLINDKTKSAIMLIGGWGTGKSYYIQNVLKPYLNDKRAKSCITVSLYGLNELKEISKSIYLEIKTRHSANSSEKGNIAKIAAKTILKGVTSYFGVDLSSNADDLQKLYDSVDLSDKLIVLEDLERTNIPIKDVLGYVNNLVEQDNAKVLLVANEKEILKSEEVVVGKDKDGNEKKEWQWTAETQEYLKIKEKTISDTIPYVCDLFETTANILEQFKDDSIEALIVDKLGAFDCDIYNIPEKAALMAQIRKQSVHMEIVSIANEISDLNFRSLIFACQKAVDMLRLYNKEIDRTFVKHLFMSTVAFSFRLKINDKLYWDENKNGYSLGTRKYPLFKFAHDYVKIQNLDTSEVEKEEELFLAQKKAEAAQTDANFFLDILYKFYLTTPIRLELAIIEIKKHLEANNAISPLIYGKLVSYLIISRGLIDNTSVIDECKTLMRQNLQNKEYDRDKVSGSLSFHDSFQFWTKEQEDEYKDFITELKSIVKNKQTAELNFDYKIENIDNFIQEIFDKKDDYINQHTFLKRIDIDKLMNIISECNSQQINELRRAILTVYSFSNIDEFFADDKPSLIKLKDSIEALSKSDEAGDKIKRMQLSWFVGNLDNILEKLS